MEFKAALSKSLEVYDASVGYAYVPHAGDIAFAIGAWRHSEHDRFEQTIIYLLLAGF